MTQQPEHSARSYLLNHQYKDAANLNAHIALHERFSTSQESWHGWIFEQLEVPARGRVLELGCGPGRLWRDNRERIPEDWRVTLSDFSPGMLEEARQGLGELAQRFSFQVIDIQHIPFEDVSFDIVIANHMLYHVPDRARAIAEVRRILKPGGRFYAATNGEGHLEEIGTLVHRVAPEVRMWEHARNAFTLENGPTQLSQSFADIQVRRYENGLRVTESGPLLAFILSTPAKLMLNDEQIAALRNLIEQEIREHGAISIRKESGLLIAS